MKTELDIGRVLKPRGIKGEFKVQTYSDNSQRFQKLKTIKIAGIEYAVEKKYLEGVFAYFKVEGIDTPEQVDALRNKSVYVKREQLPKPENGRYYIVDMLGVDVIVGGEKIGELVDILQYGSADVYVVNTADGQISFPALKALIKEVDIQNGRLVLDDLMFPRVAVYNK